MQTFKIYPLELRFYLKHVSIFVQWKIEDNNIKIGNGWKRKKNCSQFLLLFIKIKTSTYGEGRKSEFTAEEPLIPQVDPLGRPLPRPWPRPLPSWEPRSLSDSSRPSRMTSHSWLHIFHLLIPSGRLLPLFFLAGRKLGRYWWSTSSNFLFHLVYYPISLLTMHEISNYS